MIHPRHLVLAVMVVALVVAGQAQSDTDMNDIAERYVKLVLAMGQHDSDYVDAYYGPEAWRADAEGRPLTLDQIGAEAGALIMELDRTETAPDPEELVQLRHQYLRRQLEALQARVRMLGGRSLAFDDESSALYDAVAPRHPESHFEDTLTRLARALPGQGTLGDRYGAFRVDFVIPSDRLDQVFETAIAECRRRTLVHVDLPADESFTVEYVTDKSWSGYNWYQGNFRSLIQVNTDLPIYIDRAVDLACHEGYPGHHIYNVLLEQHLVRERGWPEFSVYALFSPQSLIAEGTANYGIEVAFPSEEPLAFEREVLFPAAGLDASRATEYYQVQALVGHLDYAGNEAARRYLNGEIDRAAAVDGRRDTRSWRRSGPSNAPDSSTSTGATSSTTTSARTSSPRSSRRRASAGRSIDGRPSPIYWRRRGCRPGCGTELKGRPGVRSQENVGGLRRLLLQFGPGTKEGDDANVQAVQSVVVVAVFWPCLRAGPLKTGWPRTARPSRQCQARKRADRSSTGNSDGFSARCGETRTRGWERRWHHAIFVADCSHGRVQVFDEDALRLARELMDAEHLGRTRIAHTLLAATLLSRGVDQLVTCNPQDDVVFDGLRVVDPRVESEP